MKIAIVGWGVEGQSAFKYFGQDHEYLIVSEEPRKDFPPESEKIKIQFINSERQAGLTGNVEDLSYLKGIEKCDKIIYAPVAPKNLERLFPADDPFWRKAVSIQHIFFETVKTKNIIGVTGTKGKGTASSLIYEMVKASGKNSYLGGNIGTPVLDFVKEVTPDDWVVLELSNFQLYKFPYSPHVSVCLMIVPEHLDWHKDFKEYVDTKANLFAHQTSLDLAIYFADNKYSSDLAARSPGRRIPYYQAPGAYVRADGKIVIADTEVIDKQEIKLLGDHNLQNVCAAITAVWFGVTDIDDKTKLEAIRRVLRTFSGLEHRLELVREVKGVRFINDSFAATPDAAIGAIEAIPGNKVMIMGGYDRQLPLQHLAQAVKENSNDIRKIILIGFSAERLAKELEEQGFTNYRISKSSNMPEIVKLAQAEAKSGDSVVLSPGFASFGIFKNFEHRGQEFKAAVNNL
jgi:UDP-N-acetylmuramoylalanine--D-glutamate ligase